MMCEKRRGLVYEAVTSPGRAPGLLLVEVAGCVVRCGMLLLLGRTSARVRKIQYAVLI